eukprot:8949826-Prorocentrum_lima.AAC.1
MSLLCVVVVVCVVVWFPTSYGGLHSSAVCAYCRASVCVRCLSGVFPGVSMRCKWFAVPGGVASET